MSHVLSQLAGLTATRLHELLVGEGHPLVVVVIKATGLAWKRQRPDNLQVATNVQALSVASFASWVLSRSRP